MRCENGKRRNKISGNCEPKLSPKMKREFPRCPNGTRRNKDTKACEDKKYPIPKMFEIKPLSVRTAFSTLTRSVESPSLKSQKPSSIQYEFHFARPVKHVLLAKQKKTEKRRLSRSSATRRAKRQRTSSPLK